MATLHLIDPTKVFWPYWTLFLVQVATLVALVIYVWKTWEMARATRDAARANAETASEAREARIAALAPRMMIYFATRSLNLAEIVVENAGAGTAADLMITFDPRLKSSSQNWDPARFFDTPKPLFPPGYRLIQSVDTWPAYLGGNLPKQYEVSMSYRGVETAREYKEKHILDIAGFEHRSEFNQKDMDDLVREIEKLPKALDRRLDELKSELAELNGVGSWTTTGVGTAADAISELVAMWHAAVALDESAETRVALEPMRSGFQRSALRVLIAARREGATKSVIQCASQVLVRTHVPFYVAQQNWLPELGAAVEALERATAK